MKIPETRLSAKSGFLGHQKIRKMSIFLEKSRKMAYFPVITRKLPEGVFLMKYAWESYFLHLQSQSFTFFES
jgi:hypothetical protein